MEALQNARFEFEITEAHTIAATRAAMKRHLMSAPYGILILLAYATVIFLMAALSSFEDLGPILIAAVIAPPIAYFLIMKFLIPWQAKRHFAQVSSLSRNSYAEWDEAGITLGSAKGEARFAWLDFYAWYRVPEALMLFQGEAIFSMLPVDALGEENASVIEGHLKAAGVKRR